jgi:Uma2 family endonuclease
MTEQTKTGISIDDVMAMDDKRIEIVDGQIQEKDAVSAGLYHKAIAKNFERILDAHVVNKKLGHVFSDGLTYILHTDDFGVQRTRMPDISFIKRGRITPEMDLIRPFIGAPDLAVEVTSPGQTVDSLSERVDDYLSYGSDEVWVIFVATRELYQYRLATLNTITVHKENDTFTPSDLFPGLKIAVNDLFDTSDLFN